MTPANQLLRQPGLHESLPRLYLSTPQAYGVRRLSPHQRFGRHASYQITKRHVLLCSGSLSLGETYLYIVFTGGAGTRSDDGAPTVLMPTAEHWEHARPTVRIPPYLQWYKYSRLSLSSLVFRFLYILILKTWIDYSHINTSIIHQSFPRSLFGTLAKNTP
jgi:hypothetical protein